MALRYKGVMNDEIKDTRVTILMSPSELAVLDEWRRKQSDLPNRSEAIRRLIALGVQNQKKS